MIKRMAFLGLLGIALAGFGCGDDSTTTGGTDGAGGTGAAGAGGTGAGGTGGVEPRCIEDTDCPPPQFDCQVSVCNEGLCAIEGITDTENFCEVPGTERVGQCQDGICIPIGSVG